MNESLDGLTWESRSVDVPGEGALWSEAAGSLNGLPVLLVMGSMNPGLVWPPGLVRGLVEGGCRVVRYDHRDTGRSFLSDPARPPYTLDDLTRDAMRVLGVMSKALHSGDTVAVFPEGTTGTGHGVLPFHPNLFQAAIDADVPVQPIVLRYSDPHHAVSPSTAYVGSTTLLQSLWWVVTARGLTVHVEVLPPMRATHADRRALAEHVQDLAEAALTRQLA